MAKAGKYQLFDRLRDEEYAALEADIVARGVQVPIEIDGQGNLLDGHHRKAIAKKHGIKCPSVVKKFKTEAEKREHVIKVNLCRRHLEPYQWGLAFKKLLEERGVRRGQGSSAKKQHSESATLADSAKELGVPERTARRRLAEADAYEALPKPIKRKVETGEETVSRALKQTKKADRTSRMTRTTFPKGKFRVLYADPPWEYGSSGLDNYGPAERHYPTMSIDDLCTMDVKSLAADRAVLFMWVTSPLLAECWPVIKAWGFQYKAMFVWDKVKHNYGHYNSVRHELLLICTRGSCLPDTKKLFDSVVSIERSGKHSEKPEEFRKLIEKMYSRGSRIELFARTSAKGWSAHGNELSK